MFLFCQTIKIQFFPFLVIGINVAEPKNESFNLRPIEQINVDGVEAKKSYQTEEHEFPVKCDNEEIEFAEVKVEPTLNVFNETIDFDMSELVATYDIKVEEPFEMDDIINTDGDDELKTDSFFASEASTVHSNNEIKMESTSNEPNAGNVNSEWMQDKATFAELFFCHICNKKYANPSICAKHMLSVHDIKQPDIPRPFKCPSCNLSYGRRSHMWRHYDKQHGTAAERELKKMLKDADSEKIKSAPPPDKAVIEKLSFCHICNVQYANPSVCAKHMLHVHDIEQPDIPRPHKCIMCDNSYGRSSHLWRHYEKKHGNVPDRKMKKLITVMRKREIDYEIVERHCETKSDAVVINEPESDEVFKSVLSHDTNDEPVDVNVDKATMAQLSYCHICDRKYANLGACATHMLDVHQIKLPEIPRSHKCLLCDKSYFKSNHLCRHYVRTHNKTNIKIKIKTDQMHGNASMEIVEPFIDAHSDPIADLENVKIEVAADTETAKASTYCEICEKNYTTRSNFITHMWGVHKIKVAATRSHKCVILTCKKTYKTRNTLLKHYRQDHGGNPECKLKKTERKLKKKKNSTVADVEIESNSEDKKFEMPEDVVSAKARSYCPLCDKRYANHSACATHMLQVHKITMPHIERPYECHVCKKSYVKRGHLTRHLKLGHNIGLKRMGKEADAFECYLCHESFKLREMLKKHASKFHLPIEHSSICPTCGITTRRLGRHIALSHSGTEVKCNVCQRIFSHRSRLTNHMRTHTLPSQCDLCPKRFANNGQMRQHRRYHTQEKPYVCKHCGARFIERSTCTQHERIHTGEKP